CHTHSLLILRGDSVAGGADRGARPPATGSLHRAGCEAGRAGQRQDPLGLSHVPISQLAKYFSCSFVSLSILIPIPASFNLAISLSITVGTGYTFFSSFL